MNNIKLVCPNCLEDFHPRKTDEQLKGLFRKCPHCNQYYAKEKFKTLRKNIYWCEEAGVEFKDWDEVQKK